MTYRIGGVPGWTLFLGGFALALTAFGIAVVWLTAHNMSLIARILSGVFMALLAGYCVNLMLYIRRYVISFDASGFTQRDHHGLHRAQWSDVAASAQPQGQGRLQLLDSRGKVVGTFDLDVENRENALKELVQHMVPIAPVAPCTFSRKSKVHPQVGVGLLAMLGTPLVVSAIRGRFELLLSLAIAPVVWWALSAFSAWRRLDSVSVTDKALELREGSKSSRIPWSAVTALELKFGNSGETGTSLELILEENGKPRGILPGHADPLFLYLAARRAWEATQSTTTR